ncbi:MFS transporter [Streptococcus ovuberis]|uniref:MFS transporter n=1 Tax=Streptococcus ovuberis TaxID=1936207 RepID=A0A7X6S1L3_9STRE|nr:MFS transporter [Streptococcus ovuberis]NKZ21289.1 MFS transporter [Streptococcus ovuberis]
MKRNISLFYLYQFFMSGQLSRGILMLYCLRLGLSSLEFGTLQSIYNLIRLVSEVPTGILADRVERKLILFLGTCLNMVASLGLFALSIVPLSTSFVWLAIFFALDSLGTVLASGADQAFLYEELAQHQHEQHYLKILSNSQVISLCFLAFTTALGGPIFQVIYGAIFLFQAIFYLGAGLAIGLISTPVNSRTTPSITTLSTGTTAHFKQVVQSICSNLKLAILITVMVLVEVFINALVRFIQGGLLVLGLSPTAISSLIGLATFCGILGAFLARYCQNIPLRHFLLATALLFCFGSFGLSQGWAPAVISGFILLNLLMDLIFPYLSHHINLTLPSEIRSSVLSVNSGLVGGISLVIYPLFGWLLDHFSYSGAFLATGGSLGIVLILLALTAYTKPLR